MLSKELTRLKTFKPPIALVTWDMFYEITKEEWQTIFRIPYILIRETKIQSLQFKILHRIFPCKTNLKRWKIYDIEECDECGGIEDLQYYFALCGEVRAFWFALST